MQDVHCQTTTENYTRSYTMKKITAALIAGLFATAAFAQTTTTAATPATPAVSATPAAQASVDAKTPKAAFVDNKDLKASTQTDGKLVKKVSKADAKAAAKAEKAKDAAKADAKAEVKADPKAETKVPGKSSIKPPAEAHTGTHGAEVSATAQTK
jgi:hypothetical protein